MSAINYVARPDGLFVFGDTSAYDADGIIGTFDSKITLAKGFPGVVTSTGNMLSGALAKEDALAGCTCFDELIDAARDHFQADGQDIALAVGGYSDARGEFELWLGSSVMRRQFTRVPLDNGYLYLGQPPLSAEQWRKGFGKPMASPRQIVEIDDFARTVLELQREFTWGNQDGYPHDVHLVGGWAEIASVTRTESTIRTIVEWPDKVGELIKPALVDWNGWRRTHAEQADSAPVENAPRLSRHERRAAKAKARKAA